MDHYQVFVGLQRDTWHWFWVTSVNSVGESVLSREWLGLQTVDTPDVVEVSQKALGGKATQSSTMIGAPDCTPPVGFAYNASSTLVSRAAPHCALHNEFMHL